MQGTGLCPYKTAFVTVGRLRGYGLLALARSLMSCMFEISHNKTPGSIVFLFVMSKLDRWVLLSAVLWGYVHLGQSHSR